MKPIKLLPMAMLTLLTASLIPLSTGCVRKPKVVVIDGSKLVTRLPAGQMFTPPIKGYFVPDARMKEILDRLAEKEFEQAPPK